jgi:hypothetical protein
MLMKNLYDLLHFGIEESLKQLYMDPVNLETIIRQHQRVSDAIRLRDPDAAHEAMRQHITFLINYMCDESRMLKQDPSSSDGNGKAHPPRTAPTDPSGVPTVEESILIIFIE